MYHEIFGWVGSFLFAVCAVPQAVKTWKTKKADDLSWLFLLLWLGGEWLTVSYLVIDDILLGIAHFPLYLNYIFNIVLVSYLVYAKKRYK
jgi:uncharacterized protein with PQ loop repeat